MAEARKTIAGLLLAGALLAGGPALAQDGDTALDKALQKVEAVLLKLKALPNPDRNLIADLEEAANQLRKARTDAKKEDTPAPGGGDAGGGAGGNDWAIRRGMETLLQGVELNETQKAEAERILRDFSADYNLAKTNEDNKSKTVVVDAANRRIERNFPRKEAGKMKDNLASIARFIERPWGRGR